MAQKSKRVWPWRGIAAFCTGVVRLAAWRWRTQWLLLLMTGTGIAIAVALVGALPLFSSVLTTAGLRGVLRAQPDSAQIVAQANTLGTSSSLLAATTSQVDSLMRQDAGQYLPGAPQTTVITGNWYLNYGGFTMDFYGVPIQTARAHLQVLQGQMLTENSSSSSSIDIMLTPSAAFYLRGVNVGDTIPLTTLLLSAPPSNSGAGVVPYFATINAHVVGIFQVKANDAYWDGHTLEALPVASKQAFPPFLALTDQSSLFKMLDTIAQQHGARGVFFGDKSENVVYLSYMLNTPAIIGSQLNDLISRLGRLQEDTFRIFALKTGSNITSVELFGPALHDLGAESILEKFRDQESIMQAPSLILTAQIVCLILFFVSTMSDALVEQERLSIAVLRSRGASRLQVFGSLLVQGLALCLLAGPVGPALALGLVLLVAPHLLTATTSDALNTLVLARQETLRALGISALVALAVTFLTLIFSLCLAVHTSILTQRREEARGTRQPLWQHLRLDLVLAVLALASYALTPYLENTEQFLGAQGQVLISIPLEVLAPLLLVLAGVLFFLRLFPQLLRLLARLVKRQRDLTATLALAQLERAPRQPMRMALLLGLAIAFVFFSLVFSASQSRRAQDVATYQAVSDFSGYNPALPDTTPQDATAILDQTTTRYRQIQGVTSVTVGFVDNLFLYVNSGTAEASTRPTVLIAVDANTFAQTALWSSQDSSQSLADLMALLVARRTQAAQQGVVPAIVAASTWQLLGLSPGMTFHLTDDFGGPNATTYLAVAEVKHIPPADDQVEGAVLVDYQSLVAGRAVYQQTTQPNYIWLRTGNSPAAINYVRSVLSTSPMALTDLLDRRALSGEESLDPLSRNLTSILGMGVAAALLLALLANLLLPLLGVHERQTTFAVLRALGTTSEQITRMLLWEMATVLLTALLLGLLFGTLLTLSAVQPLIFTAVLPTNLASVSSTSLYTIQQIVPITVVVPPSLLVALVILLALCVLALGLMARLAQAPLLGQALRVDND
ncbi:MAG TPA: FtsX-like permease family protein [Ktedonobacteraceae bacterium]|nr:FtsX-like permease family protein [Ktedonobacteraceae bacterium]